MRTFLLLFIILILRIKCFSHTIKNCEKLDENKNQCTKCKDNHFLFFHNVYCLPCDDKNYGQVGCGGNCNSSEFENDRFVYVVKMNVKKDFMIYMVYVLIAVSAHQDVKHVMLLELLLKMVN